MKSKRLKMEDYQKEHEEFLKIVKKEEKLLSKIEKDLRKAAKTCEEILNTPHFKNMENPIKLPEFFTREKTH